MINLPQEKFDHLRALLDDRETRLRAEIEREVGTQDSFNDVATEIPDTGDASFADLQIDVNNAAVRRDVVELRAIRAARKRIEDGTYGDCTKCGTEIPYERMEVQPTAERCAPCQEMYEKTHADAGRGATL